MIASRASRAPLVSFPPGSSAPNFFIVGAPKSGTTSLDVYLRKHPSCFLCRKEPHFFATDFLDRGVDRAADYVDLFAKCPPGTAAVGEASVWYLYSRDAIPNLRREFPEARLIAMLRNPVDLIYSKHAQLVFNCEEDESDFERAWRLEPERRAGRQIPATALEPSFLYYSEVGRLGEQVARMLSVFPAEQVHLILFEDFCADAGRHYRNVLDFLGLRDDGRTAFPRVNPNTVHRSKLIGRLLQKPPAGLQKIVRCVERRLGLRQLPGIDLIRHLNTKVAARKPLDPAFRAELTAHFRPEVERLEGVLGRDLSAWKRP